MVAIPLACTFSAINVWAADDAVSVGDVSVIGQKVTRSNTTLNKKGIENATPGTAPIQLLNKLPGVNATAGGSLGLYEYATQIYVRGFDKNQVGQVLDGVPLGGGLTAGGAPANRFIDSENLMKINVSQGSADIASPSNSALGGTITYTTAAPKNAEAFKVARTTGSFNLERTFVRYDSGLIGSTKAYVSVSNTTFDKWRSKGALNRQHAEFKAVHLFGDSGLEIKSTYNDRSDHDYLDVKLSQYNKYGRYYGLNTTWTGNPDLDSAHFDGWTNGRTDTLHSIKLDSMLSDDITLKVQPYYHAQHGWGRYNPNLVLTVDPVTGVATPSATPGLSFRESTYQTNRAGVTASVTAQLGFNALKAGLWMEKGTRKNGRNWYNTINSAVSYMPDRTQLYFNQFDRTFKTTSSMLYLQDSIALLDDNLNVDVGVKSRNTDVTFNGLSNNRVSQTSLTTTSNKGFLPKLGLSYKLGDAGQVFTSYSENYSQLPDSVFTQETFNSALKPETSTNMDIGYRYDNGSTSFTASYYNISYKNKLEVLTVTAGNRFFGNTTKLSNVGGVDTTGIEVAAGQQIGKFNLYSTVTVNDSTYKEDIQTLKIKGNRVIGQPKYMATAEINYKSDAYSIGFVEKFVGTRMSSRDNSEAVPKYYIGDLHIGYDSQKSFGALKDIGVSFNVNNLFDESYLSTILGSNTGLNTGGGAAYYVGTPRNISMMISASM